MATSGPTASLSSRERQRRRKKRTSRDFDDHNESLESPSSIPERIPLHEMADGEKANGSAEGDINVYDGNEVQMHTLETPDKKRHKRPMGSRHAPRSASAEVLHRMEEEEMADGENMSPTRRRNRRRRGHGSKDFIDDDMDDYGGDAGLAGEHMKRPRPRKHKAKKPSRHQNATSGEEENYNADMDGEELDHNSLFIDKQSLLFVDGHGFRSERKARINQLEEDRRNALPMDVERERTTAEFAVSVHKTFRSFALFCHGLLAGRDELHMYDMANPRSGFFHGLLTRPSRILSISAYLFALVFSISVANIDDRISLYQTPQKIMLFLSSVPYTLIANFRSDYEYENKYEYQFWH
ncbi:hypothetical protein QZH41_018467 [Actinostola sp. cb2023]|nr:hypothetical protein QZH41_018467 [Actinostola sp. cb2023]